MNTNLLLVLDELKHAKPTWSCDDYKYKLKLMDHIARSVERRKQKLKCTTTTPLGTRLDEFIIKEDERIFIRLLENIGPVECGEDLYNALMMKIKGEVVSG